MIYSHYLVVLPQRLSVGHGEQGDAHLWIKENTGSTRLQFNKVETFKNPHKQDVNNYNINQTFEFS